MLQGVAGARAENRIGFAPFPMSHPAGATHLSYSFCLPLGLDSLLGFAFGSAALGVEVPDDFDSEELLSDLDSEDFEPELLSDLDSELLLSEAADFL